jgi:hypothetical protein
VYVQKGSTLRMSRLGFYISIVLKVMPESQELSPTYLIQTNEI